MSMSWTISVEGRAYGPYTLEQMTTFQIEGRLAPHSLVARVGEEQIRQASEDVQLASLFSSAARTALQSSTEVRQIEPHPGSAKFGRDHQTATGHERSRYIIVSDMKSGSIATLEDEIFNFGPACRCMPQAWILVSEVSLSTIRGELIQKMGKHDALIVVDTTHDKAAWFNFGPEADTKVRRLWQRESVPAKNSA
jgi:hypothetical protein